MMMVGQWAPGHKSRHVKEYFNAADAFRASTESLDVSIGGAGDARRNVLTEGAMWGQVSTTAEEATECSLGDAGSFRFNLTRRPLLSYTPGYATSDIVVAARALSMWWVVPGMRMELEGTVTVGGGAGDVEGGEEEEVFDAVPATSFAYQDKNWGTDYTNPWLWISCNSLTSTGAGSVADPAGSGSGPLDGTSLDVGGGRPRVFGVPIPAAVLLALFYRGRLYEFNFSKFWRLHFPGTTFKVEETDTSIRWHVVASDLFSKVEVDVTERKEAMLKIKYENPDGAYEHRSLWNGGNATGTVTLSVRRHPLAPWQLVDTMAAARCGCEWGSAEPDRSGREAGPSSSGVPAALLLAGEPHRPRETKPANGPTEGAEGEGRGRQGRGRGQQAAGVAPRPRQFSALRAGLAGHLAGTPHAEGGRQRGEPAAGLPAGARAAAAPLPGAPRCRSPAAPARRVGS